MYNQILIITDHDELNFRKTNQIKQKIVFLTDNCYLKKRYHKTKIELLQIFFTFYVQYLFFHREYNNNLINLSNMVGTARASVCPVPGDVTESMIVMI